MEQASPRLWYMRNHHLVLGPCYCFFSVPCTFVLVFNTMTFNLIVQIGVNIFFFPAADSGTSVAAAAA